MPNLVLLLGLSGTGKSALVREILAKLPKKIDHIIVGDLIKEIGSKKTIFEDRDEIRRRAKTGAFREIQKLVFQKLYELVNNGHQKDIIIDTHSLVSTQSGFLPGIPRNSLDKLKPDLIVFVESDPKAIQKRRQRDREIGRDRDKDRVEYLSMLQEMSKIAAVTYSAYLGAPILLINNEEGRLKEAAKILRNALENLGS